jgi:tagatose-6-phosphate ketose/aldose isomerase
MNIGRPLENVLLGFDYIIFAQTLAVLKSLSLGITPDNPCPTGEVNRVVQGVTLYPYTLK